MKKPRVRQPMSGRTIVGLLAIASVVTFTSLLSLYKPLTQHRERELLWTVQTKALAMQGLWVTARETGEHLWEDSQLRQSWADYNQGKISRQDYRESIAPQLEARLDEFLVGIAHWDENDQPVVQVGVQIPQPSEWLSRDREAIAVHEQSYLILRQEIGGDRGLGSNLMIFALNNFPPILSQTSNTNLAENSGVALIDHRDKLEVFPLGNFPPTNRLSVAEKRALTEVLDNQSAFPSTAINCRDCSQVMAYAPMIDRENWGVIAIANKRQLYRGIDGQMALVGVGAIAATIGLGSLMAIALRRRVGEFLWAQPGDRCTLEHALEQEQQFSRALFEANPAFFVAIRADGKVLLMNQSMLDRLGYTLDEAIGRDYLSNFVPKPEQETVAKLFVELLQHDRPTRNQNHVLTKDKREILVEWHGRTIFNKETGEVEFFFGVGIDISNSDRAAAETRLLQQITQDVSEAADFESAIAVALRRVGETTDWEFGEAWIPNEEGTELSYSPVWYYREPKWERFRRCSENYTLAANEGLPGRVYSSRHPEWIQDVSRVSGEVCVRHQIAAECGLKAGLGVPIVQSDRVLAVLVFFMSAPGEEDRHAIDLVSSVAMQLGGLFQRKQAVRALQQAEAKYRSIVENAVEGIFQITPQGQYRSANSALAKIYGYASVGEMMTCFRQVDYQHYVDPNRGQEFLDLLRETGRVSGFEAQVYRQDGSKIWVLQNLRAVCDGGELLYYEGSVVEITSRKWTEEQLRYNASHDALTGLWNRSFFMDRLVKAVSRNQMEEEYGFAVLFLDLDDFKLVNDSWGHAVGDRLLMAIAGRLERRLRDGDTLARFGGDEFTILLENIGGIEAAIAIAEEIQEGLSEPFHVSDREIFASASIGIVHSISGDCHHPDFLRDADIAMYRAKAMGKKGWAIFDAAMREETVRRLELETDLRRAIEREEFEMCYQPILRLGTFEISGFEALMRWNHPRRGVVSPGEFIPVAEEAGLIAPLGEWSLREACRQLRIWKKQFPTYPCLRMSVNLSGKQLTPDLSDRIGAILRETGVEGWDLKLEITETAIVADPQGAIAIFKQLKARDIQLCIDDFGTGYCSLSYLYQFPVDILKIDRSFICKMADSSHDNAQIVRTIIALAHGLGMDAIAEGIENIEQVQHLELLKCKYGQGYFFSPPLNRKQTEVFLAQHQLSQTPVV
ncbi:EAL domain-containing protein [Phormidium sp. CCY1219]|uniref:EAL domain-containing protein n=1 Tax=Phormidium sp. CCY1219 TaxID=2886104 RepID=UPI002D781F3F|nr:EAL domain-containing protein [Phormidium sp. CCY1219]